MNLPSIKPLNKVSVGFVTAIVGLTLWLLSRYAGLDTEAVTILGPFLVVIIGNIFSYLTPLSEAEVHQIVQSPAAPDQLPEAARVEAAAAS